MQTGVVLSQQPYQKASAPRIYRIFLPVSINPALAIFLGSECCTDALLPVGDLLPVLTGPSQPWHPGAHWTLRMSSVAAAVRRLAVLWAVPAVVLCFLAVSEV